MSSIDWNNGQFITLTPGDTATCTDLNPGQLYGLFFYNSAGNDAGATVTVAGSNVIQPLPVTVPGTTANQGLAAICFVSANDTTTVSASIVGQQPGVQVSAFICSVKFPIDSSVINNKPLPANGQPQPFKAFTRYYAVPESHWNTLTISSDINSFMVVQFLQSQAVVYAVNSQSVNNLIYYYGTSAPKMVETSVSGHQTISKSIMGNGQQFVWMNADSVQNAESATISLQSLAGIA